VWFAVAPGERLVRFAMVTIADIRARRVWDSRGLPTVEVELYSDTGKKGRAIAPAGASTGRREVPALLDGGDTLAGKDVSHALAAITTVLAPHLVGSRFASLDEFDRVLVEVGGPHSDSPVGANSTTAASLAMVQLLAAEAGVSPWRVVGETPRFLPRPQIQIMGGGAHAANRVAVQDFMVYPMAATSVSEALIQVAEVYRRMGTLLASQQKTSGVADEGGHWPNVTDTEEALELIVRAIADTGLQPGVDMAMCLDIAATQFYRDGKYVLGDKTFSPEEWVSELARWASAFPIASIEDPVHEDDDEGMIAAVSDCSAVIVGDDYLVTDAARIREVPAGSVEAVLIKVNQIGTVTGARDAVHQARDRGMYVIVSARSGETEDTSVSHLATGWEAEIMKVGSITRGERTAKWNELLRIDDELGGIPMAPALHKSHLAVSNPPQKTP